MRRAARTDKNQSEIVRSLRQMGVSVEVIGKPVDLLVCFRGETSLVELKSPNPDGGDHGITKTQRDFMDRWPGKIVVARTAAEVIEGLMPGVTK